MGVKRCRVLVDVMELGYRGCQTAVVGISCVVQHD